MNQQMQDDGLDRSAEVVLADVRESALSVDEVLAAVRHPRAGGIASFIGVVREQDHGEAVDALDYSAHPTATDVLRAVARVPIWKHQMFSDGTDEWVGLP
jgi:molybdopterin synthase catalytic subunit